MLAPDHSILMARRLSAAGARVSVDGLFGYYWLGTGYGLPGPFYRPSDIAEMRGLYFADIAAYRSFVNAQVMSIHVTISDASGGTYGGTGSGDRWSLIPAGQSWPSDVFRRVNRQIAQPTTMGKVRFDYDNALATAELESPQGIAVGVGSTLLGVTPSLEQRRLFVRVLEPSRLERESASDIRLMFPQLQWIPAILAMWRLILRKLVV